jgi:hypothetical protein
MTFISPGLYDFGGNRTKAARHCLAGHQVAIGGLSNLHPQRASAEGDFRTLNVAGPLIAGRAAEATE